jgi:hypothetical protein
VRAARLEAARWRVACGAHVYATFVVMVDSLHPLEITDEAALLR